VLLVVATFLHSVGVGVTHAVNVHFSVLVVVAVKYRNASLLRFSTAAVMVTWGSKTNSVCVAELGSLFKHVRFTCSSWMLGTESEGRKIAYTVLVDSMSVVLFNTRVTVDDVSVTINVLIAYEVTVTVGGAAANFFFGSRICTRPSRTGMSRLGTCIPNIMGCLVVEVALVEDETVVFKVEVEVLVLEAIVHGVDNVENTVVREWA
jgi:hypothetical protein